MIFDYSSTHSQETGVLEYFNCKRKSINILIYGKKNFFYIKAKVKKNAEATSQVQVTEDWRNY